MPRKGEKMSEAQRKKLSETRKKRIKSGKISTWNKGLTKSDPRVLKNISGGSRKTQFKPGRPRPETKGEKNPYWRGGEIITSNGYVMVRIPEHPAAKNNSGYVLKHRLVMEKHIGRYLVDGEVVHHMNHDKQDNRIENLMIMTLGEHTSYHNTQRKD